MSDLGPAPETKWGASICVLCFPCLTCIHMQVSLSYDISSKSKHCLIEELRPCGSCSLPSVAPLVQPEST